MIIAMPCGVVQALCLCLTEQLHRRADALIASAELGRLELIRGRQSTLTRRNRPPRVPSIVAFATGLKARYKRVEEDQEIREAALNDVIFGSYVFTGERSAKSYHLNKMANTLRSSETRERFRADEAGYMRELGCSDQEIDLVQRRDWKAMMEYGASIYMLLKIGAAVGHSLPQIGAHTSGIMPAVKMTPSAERHA